MFHPSLSIALVFLAAAARLPAAADVEALFTARALTAEGSFTPGVEGPACDAAGNIYAVNFGSQQTIGKIAPDGSAELFVTLPGTSVGNGIRFTRDGVMYVADYVGHNVLRVDPKTRAVSVFAHDDRMNQPNDLALAADGTLYASDPDWKAKTGQLWRIDRDGSTHLLASGLGTTNGIDVSPDGRTLYVNESEQRGVWAFPIAADRSLGPRRLVRQFDDFGFDGMRCDVDGNLYITRHFKGTVVKLSPAGETLREIDVLGAKPSNICFGGPDGRTAYVTEVEHRRLVQFRVDRPGLEWQRLHDAPAFGWAASAGALKNDKTRNVAVDREGNVFVAGEMTDAGTFGNATVKSAGGMDFVIAKLNPQGQFLWAQSGGGSLVDRGYGVAPDGQGGCYVTGHYQSTDADFSGTQLPNRGNYDLFVAKYDRDGKLVWIRTAGGAGYDYGHGIAVDGRGDVVVTGAVVGEAEFGGTKMPNETGSHIFCAKYHADGSLVWVKVAGGKAGGSGHGVAVDGPGNIYIGGLSSGTGQFGDQPLVTPKGSSSVVAKLAPDGNVLWIAQNFGEPSCLFHEITCDREGRVWASGMFKGKLTVGADTFTTTGDKDSDALLCHYDSAGKLLWTRVGQGPAVDYGLGIATDGEGNSFLTGEFTDIFKLGGAELRSRGSTDVYVAKFDAQGGLRWLIQGGGDKGDNAYSMVSDARGNLFLGGSFGGTARFDEASITSTGSNDLYVAKLKAK